MTMARGMNRMKLLQKVFHLNNYSLKYSIKFVHEAFVDILKYILD